MTPTQYADEGESHPPSRMVGIAGDPWLKVHALAESIFCPRAGILAHENQREEDDDEPPSLYTLPKYELAAIEQALVELKAKCSRDVLIIAGLVICGMVARSYREIWALIVIAVVIIKMCQRLWQRVWEGIELFNRRYAAIHAHCAEPDPKSETMQVVNWFGLLKLGFESVRLREPLRDPLWQLEGRPWRVLRKGSLVIPVFPTKSSLNRPREQHTAKIMAYCRLVERSFQVQCPYGIILTQDDHSGFSVPHTAKFRSSFHKHLLAFRTLARESDSQGVSTPISYSPQACRLCPLGEPHSVRNGRRVQRLGVLLPIVVLRDHEWNEFRCDCGDRFGWKPPHARNQELRGG